MLWSRSKKRIPKVAYLFTIGIYYSRSENRSFFYPITNFDMKIVGSSNHQCHLLTKKEKKYMYFYIFIYFISPERFTGFVIEKSYYLPRFTHIQKIFTEDRGKQF